MSNMVVRTNVLAINSHRNLGMVGKSQEKASTRLSSGYRINSAADDASGLAISEKMRSQIRGLDQANRNTQDGISLIQTAEGGMQEINNMLTRTRELLVQASNDTADQTTGAEKSQGDRQKVQDEINQLMQEIDSMADRVEFNKKKVINGTYADSSQALADATVGLTEAKAQLTTADTAHATATKEFGQAEVDKGMVSALNEAYNTAATALDNGINTAVNTAISTINGLTAPTLDAADATSQGAFTTAFNNAKGEVTQWLMDTKNSGGFNAMSAGDFESKLKSVLDSHLNTESAFGAGNGKSTGAVTIGGFDAATAATGASAGGAGLAAGSKTSIDTEIDAMAVAVKTVFSASQARLNLDGKATATDASFNTDTAQFFHANSTVAGPAATNASTVLTQFTSAANSASITSAPLNINDLRGILSKTTVNEAKAKNAVKDAKVDQDRAKFNVSSNESKLSAATKNASAEKLHFQIGANSRQAIEVSIGSIKTDALGLGDGEGNTLIDVVKASGKEITDLIANVDEALTQVTTERSKLGAVQNRLEFTSNSLGISSENLSASESRVRDADMAKEMMSLTQSNVLQQAATSMLAQANQSKQSVLQVLG